MSRGNGQGVHPWVVDFETKIIRGEACARKLLELKKEGLTPDIICIHPGWGEGMFIREVWANTPILSYQEFFYQPSGADYGFDPEFHNLNNSWEELARVRVKKGASLMSLEDSDWSVSPTKFQKSTFPVDFHSKISTIHDGINTAIAKPLSSEFKKNKVGNFSFDANTKYVTFVNRTIEPYRGAHIFIRSIPEILKINSDIKIIIVGDTRGVSYGRPAPNGSWCNTFLKEIEGKYDKARVHFTGRLSYEDYILVLQHAYIHVYLSYPFVLSWSMMEAMSIGCAIIGSKTAPVMEMIEDNKNGLLIDFFDKDALVEAITKLHRDDELRRRLGMEARQKILKEYNLDRCIARHLSLIKLVASNDLV